MIDSTFSFGASVERESMWVMNSFDAMNDGTTDTISTCDGNGVERIVQHYRARPTDAAEWRSCERQSATNERRAIMAA